MTKTMETPAQTTKKVICKKSELGIRVGKEYIQIRRYELYKGFWLRTILIEGKEQNFEDDCFKDAE